MDYVFGVAESSIPTESPSEDIAVFRKGNRVLCATCNVDDPNSVYRFVQSAVPSLSHDIFIVELGPPSFNFDRRVLKVI